MLLRESIYLFLSFIIMLSFSGCSNDSGNGGGNSNLGQPTARDDSAQTDFETSVEVKVLANDTFGPDGASSAPLQTTSNPGNGTATVNGHSITYTPSTGFSGQDSFMYKICDADGDCDNATVTITVNPAPEPTPVLSNDTASSTKSGAVKINVLSNDDFSGTSNLQPVSIKTQPANGKAAVDNNGTSSPEDDSILYRPNHDYTGNDSFVYEICNSSGNCVQATVNLTVNDAGASIFPSLTANDLLNAIRKLYTPETVLSYRDARIEMFTNIDKNASDEIEGIYTGFKATLTNPNDAIQDMLAKGINTEHTYPQSKGASQEPARADIFHLRPSKDNVNSDRGSLEFAEIDDNTTDRWYYLSTSQSGIPGSDIDNWSEADLGVAFEPREGVKGDVARGIFYFFTIYNSVADQSFFNGMLTDLLSWHTADVTDTEELARNDKIRAIQGNNNPFILDASLANRAYN